MAYEYGQTLAPETMPALDSYVATAQSGYDQAEGDFRQQATRELDAEISGRDQQNRLAGYQRMATDQGFTDERDRFKSGMAMKRADMGEGLRQRGQQRGWDVADRDERLYQLRKKAQAARDQRQDEERGGLMGEIGTGVGTVIGGLAGGLLTSESGGWGAVPGMALGGGIGGAIGSAS